MTFKEAAIEILKNSDIPLSASEIWDKINKTLDFKTLGKTPSASLNTILLFYSDNSNTKHHYKNKIFTIVSKSPNKFSLRNKISDIPEIEIKSDIIDEHISDIEYITNEIFYECVMDDNETILKVYNIDGTLSYNTEVGKNFTYFFPDEHKSLIKIGRTKNIIKRFNTLKTGNPDINIDLILPSETYEKTLHIKFYKYKHKLEWFFHSNEIKKFINYEKEKRKLAIDCYREYKESQEIEDKFLSLF